MIKNLLSEAVSDKIFGTKWRSLVKSDRTIKIRYLLLRGFLTAIAKV